MKLKKLTINNFKMFESLELSFAPGFNLLLGDNGVGKTSILEAAAVAMGGFLTGMEDVATRNIYIGDIRYHIEKDNNGIPNKSYHYPPEISCDIEFVDEPYFWTRQKNSPEGKTTTNPKDIYKVARNLVNAIPLYSGSKLYIKKEYIGMLEQRFGTLMMKTYVQSYKQTY